MSVTDEVLRPADKCSFEQHVPTGLIVTGPNIASQELLFTQITGRLRSEGIGIAVTIRSGDATNLKTLLKKLIRDATNQRSDDNDNEELQSSQHGGRRLLNYDLEALHDHVKLHSCPRVVVAFQDSEAFDSGLLGETLLLLHSWLDRIPFIALFGIATSVELFHERLPRSVLRLLHGAQFDVEQTSIILEKIFRAAVADKDAPLFLGSSILSAILDRQEEHVQSLQTFVMSLKYVYMTHFYANPLSLLLSDTQNASNALESLQAEHFDALRMLPSFQRHIEALVEEDAGQAKALLEDDEALRLLVQQCLVAMPQMSNGKKKEIQHFPRSYRDDMLAILLRLEVLMAIANQTNEEPPSYVDLYLKAFEGALIDDPGTVDNVVEVFRYAKREDLLRALREVVGVLKRWEGEQAIEDFVESLDALELLDSLIREKFGDDVKSTYILSKEQTQQVRTTIVAQRVRLSTQKASVTAEELAHAEQYTRAVDAFVDILRSLLVFPDPNTLLFNEIFLFSSRSPNRQVFTPRPRFTIEEALSNPHSYLDCECCASTDGTLLSTNPPTAILYQLYLETGGLINIFDLWSAFYAVVSGAESNASAEDADDSEEDLKERLALTQFYRALADLKLLGMVRMSKKKTDHVAKTSWKGL